MTYGLLEKDLREKRKGEKKFGRVFKFIVDINATIISLKKLKKLQRIKDIRRL